MTGYQALSIVLREFARVLKPGGRLILVDALQHGDEPDYDGVASKNSVHLTRGQQRIRA